jgi:hypothetical protein
MTLLALLTLQTDVVRIDCTKPIGPISPYVYGTNTNDWSGPSKYLTLGRQGGNRMTAYNWENNASNAGSDWQHQNDAFLGGGDKPGEVPRAAVASAQAAAKAFVVTVPMAGYVAADKNGDGDVNKTPNHLEVRFRKNAPRKSGTLSYPPSLTDRFVYQNEFVHWLEGTFQPRRAPIFYSLDNEPDLWTGTHDRIRPQKLTYAELVERTVDFASAIKEQAPKGLVFGPVSYGWNGYTSLQDAPDANGRDFLDFYLESMLNAERTKGRRLLDVLDVHWYPEARGGGNRVTENVDNEAIREARMHAPRSLYDPYYVERSWITDVIKEPIRLLPRLKLKIANGYPGTKLAITEYNYGGSDISSAIAQADAVGAFGREGLFAAAWWHLGQDPKYVFAAFDAYRNYDGKGAAFGDLALRTSTPAFADVPVYASTFVQRERGVVLVLINRTKRPQNRRLALTGFNPKSWRQFVLDESGPAVKLRTTGKGVPNLVLPALSVSTVELK